jgi:hypothetical protein
MSGTLTTSKCRTALLLLTLMVGVFACDDDNDCGPAPCPPTPTTGPPTPTMGPPTPPTCPPAEDTIGTLYELLDGSVFIYSPSPGSDLVAEPLTGTFRLERLPPDPNVRLGYELRGLRFCGGSRLTVESTDVTGSLGIFGPPGPIISGGIEVRINGGEPVLLSGRGPYHFEDAEIIILDGLDVCAPPRPPSRCANFQSGTENGLYVKIFAAPKNTSD